MNYHLMKLMNQEFTDFIIKFSDDKTIQNSIKNYRKDNINISFIYKTNMLKKICQNFKSI